MADGTQIFNCHTLFETPLKCFGRAVILLLYLSINDKKKRDYSNKILKTGEQRPSVNLAKTNKQTKQP